MTISNTRRATIQSVKTHRDARGTLFEPLTDAELHAQKNVHVVLTQPNEVRGNHVHRTAVETTTVVGPCRVRLKEEGEIKDIDVAAGEITAADDPARGGARIPQYRQFRHGAGVLQHQPA